VPPLRGRAWNASTITGNAKRESGMLTNVVYRGQIVWNRVARVKDPTTGKRTPRINPKSEWQHADAPTLRIVDDELWNAVQGEIKTRSRGSRGDGPGARPGPRRLLSGMLKCGECGSGIVSVGSDHGRPVARCSRVSESGDCSNKRRVYLDAIESAVIEKLREQLKEPQVIAEALREFHAEMERLSGERERTRATDEKKLAQMRSKVTRMVQQFADGALSGHEAGRVLAQTEAEADALEAHLASDPPPKAVTLHPQAMSCYIAALDQLRGKITTGENETALKMLRQLVDRIVIHSREAGEPLSFDIHGKLMALLDPSVGSMVPPG
jgi:site-specific DNA recombinase